MRISRNLFYILLIGLFIRLILMPFFVHWDLPALYEMVHYITLHHVKDVYTLIYNNYNHWAAVYPPLTFFSLASYLFIIKRIMPLFDVVAHFDLNSTFYPAWVNSAESFRYLFLLKLPYLFFDLALGLLLTKLFNSESKKEKVLKLWMFCPVSLYVTFIFGQFDVIPTFFVILALFFLKSKKINLLFLSLGIAIALKNYPLFLLLPVVIIIGGNFKSIIKNLFLGLSPFVLSILPFINKMSFRDPVLYSNTSAYLFKNKMIIGEGDSLIPFFFFYSLILLFFLVKEKIKENQFSDVVLACTLVLVSLFSFSYFHPQWFLWLMPFFIIQVVYKENLKYLYWVSVILFIPYLFHFSSSTTWLLFDIINPTFFHNYLKSPKFLIDQIYNADNLLHIARSFLSATLILFGLTVFKERNLNENT